MADDGQESEVFEITDFTTASDWERFIARLEEVMHDWKLPTLKRNPPVKKGEYTIGSWKEKSANVRYANFTFTITEYKLKQEYNEKDLTLDDEESEDILPEAVEDLMMMENDFPPRAHCLCRWFGLRHFLVLSPAAHSDAVISESRIRILQSSVSIAISNTSCQIPVFVQVQQKWRRMYVGQCEGPGMRTSFDMVHLKKIPHQFNHLAGLLGVFKSKISTPVSSPPPVSVAVRFTYILQDWTNYSWPQLPPDFDAPSGSEVGNSGFGKLPFGAVEDPVSELHLATTWPSLSEDMIVDNDVYSDLDPIQAPQWSVRIRMMEKPQCLLGEYLGDFGKLCKRSESVEQLLGRSFYQDDSDTADISQALQRLTEPVPMHIPTLSSVVTRARTRMHHKKQMEEEPIPGDILNEILQFLFPDSGAPCLGSCLLHQKLQMLNCCIARKIARENTSMSQSSSAVSLGTNIQPSLSSNSFLPASLSQASFGGSDRGSLASSPSNKDEDEDDDEFFECDEDPEEGENEKVGEEELAAAGNSQDVEMEDVEEKDKIERTEKEEKEKPEKTSDDSSPDEIAFRDTVVYQPEGRLRQCGDLTLICNDDELLYIPITQDPAPMTEDQLEEHATVLAELGTSEEGAELRARMQSACLLSDMEAFKAANPGCMLEDFVRWYSPRDYIEDDDSCNTPHPDMNEEDRDRMKKGKLSSRMMIPGNMWQEVWSQAKPVPARRQKRLFDDTKEAEKVLHYLASLKPAEVALHLMPMLIHAAIIRIQHIEIEGLPSLTSLMTQITQRASKLTRMGSTDIKKYEEVIKQIELAEVVIARAQSLRAKFSQQVLEDDDKQTELEKFVSSLLEQPEVSVLGAGRGPAGTILHRLFAAAQRSANMLPSEEELLADDDVVDHASQSSSVSVKDFPRPAGKEFILRTRVQRPTSYSRALPQRLFCVLMNNDFRLAGAFSEDTTFF
uniref:Rab3 GTPase-activating protein catalytic subunit n=1 Tax=Saccoglossus kowalevskii TaxID=10224 RepID=A0ABM0M8R4_SACKO|nr:PREDICTED: rab3 GTPase-activating protein catalytic subunit-like [Saccoglossus kowalevskii]